LYKATLGSDEPSAVLQDALHRLLRQVVRTGGLLEPHPAHQHAGIELSISEAFALGELSEADILSQQELAARLGLEKSTVSRLAAGMEARGWLSRRRAPGNRRFYELSLTKQGQQVARRFGEDLTSRHARLLALLTPQERRALEVGVTGLVRVIESHLDSPEHRAVHETDG
jgi:DNA-binding MarR family transcriptional regulator